MTIKIVDNFNHLYVNNYIEIDGYTQALSLGTKSIDVERSRFEKKHRIVKLIGTLEPFIDENYKTFIEQDLRLSGLEILHGQVEIKLKNCQIMDSENKSCFVYEAYFKVER